MPTDRPSVRLDCRNKKEGEKEEGKEDRVSTRCERASAVAADREEVIELYRGAFSFRSSRAAFYSPTSL